MDLERPRRNRTGSAHGSWDGEVRRRVVWGAFSGAMEVEGGEIVRNLGVRRVVVLEAVWGRRQRGWWNHIRMIGLAGPMNSTTRDRL